MTGRGFEPVAQDQLDARLRELLDLEARQVPGAPSRDAMVDRLARSLGTSAGEAAARGRTSPVPTLRLVVAVALLAALFAGIVAVGSRLLNTNPIVVAPSQLASGPPPPSVDLCPGGTRREDIRDDGTLADGEPLWVSGAAPSVPRVSSQIAVMGTSTPAPGGGPVRGVYLLDTESDSSCLLVELGIGQTVTSMLWSPSGDALEMTTDGGTDGYESLVWSRLGTRRISAIGSATAWAPDGSGFLFGEWTGEAAESGIRFLPADGSEALAFRCEPERTNPCPAPPKVIWSPDSTRFAVFGGDRPPPGLFSIATMSDRQLRRIDVGTMFGPDGPIVEGWIDTSTLLVWHEGSYYRVPLDDPRTSSLVGPAPTLGSLPFGDMSPDLASVHFATADIEDHGDPLIVVELASGTPTTVLRPADIADDLGLYQVRWSPDSSRLAVAMTASQDPQGPDGADPRPVVPGVWVVDRDGAAVRQITSMQLLTSGGGTILAWRPSPSTAVQQ